MDKSYGTALINCADEVYYLAKRSLPEVDSNNVVEIFLLYSTRNNFQWTLLDGKRSINAVVC